MIEEKNKLDAMEVNFHEDGDSSYVRGAKLEKKIMKTWGELMGDLGCNGEHNRFMHFYEFTSAGWFLSTICSVIVCFVVQFVVLPYLLLFIYSFASHYTGDLFPGLNSLVDACVNGEGRTPDYPTIRKWIKSLDVEVGEHLSEAELDYKGDFTLELGSSSLYTLLLFVRFQILTNFIDLN